MKLSAFGLYVRKLRLDLGLNLRAMAVALGVSSPYLSSIELGERALTEKIAEATIEYFRQLEVSSDQLFELRTACDQSMKTVQVASLDGEQRNLVAAFARRLSEGNGVPDDVMNYIRGGLSNGGD